MPGPPLRGIFSPCGHVDDVDGEIGQLRAEGGGQVVAAGFDEDQVEFGKFPLHLGDRREIDGGILADGGVRAAAGLHAHDARLGQRAGAHQDQRVLLGVDVVGDGADVVAVAEGLAQRLHQRRLAGADRAADADAQGAVGGFAMCIPCNGAACRV